MHFVQTGFVIFHLWVSYLYIIIIIYDGDTIDSMTSLYSKSHFLEHAVVIVWKWRIYMGSSVLVLVRGNQRSKLK